MFRKMFSAVAVLALLQVLSAGAVQARPLAAGPVSAGVLQEIWDWAASSLAPMLTKDGSAADPNGLKRHPVHSIRATETGGQRPGAVARGM
jgi:hypothetical protein